MTSSKNYIMQTSYLATYNNSSISVSNLNGTFYLDNGGYLKQGTNGICYYSSTGILIKDLSSELGNSISLTNWFTDLNNMFITFNGSALKSYYVTENDFTEANITQVGSINKFIVTTEGILLISSDSKTVHYFKQSDSTVSGLVYKQTRFLSGVDKTAVESDILYGKTAVGMNGSITGTMNNLGDLSIIPNTTGGTISSGFVNSINIAAVTSSIDPNITANNIANGVNILGITGVLDSGTNTQDANATASDLVYGKTAYVNGEKITGTISEMSGGLAGVIGLSPDTTRSINYTSNEIVFSMNTYLGSKRIANNYVNCEIFDTFANFSNAINLTPNILKSGENILGVIGTYEGSGGGVTFPPGTSHITFTDSIFVDSPNIDTSNIFDMHQMFYNCQFLLNVVNYNTNNVGNMYGMFGSCSRLNNLSSNFNTASVTNMQGMFHGCSELVVVPEFNTAKVTDMGAMFRNCYALVNAPNFDISKVYITQSMFSGCNHLTTVPNYITSNLQQTYNMFNNCVVLTDIPAFDLNKVTDMSYMFNNCKALVNVPDFNVVKVTNMTKAFYNCNKLSDASIQNIINMCLNSNIRNTTLKNLANTNQYSPLNSTKFNKTYYQNRWDELTAAGWAY